ncbi:hypothetical protein GCM10025868_15200 [Angustibacter aerolatus]|uniref:Amidoligase enzyme n=1 Tax=Angustibacter aerolatus TaxID=1162965 RepID=A0ABQ6JGD8_9ACTN|nr:hypothetical protein GCM10025868_15200 [Angustibacter aerolatus]
MPRRGRCSSRWRSLFGTTVERFGPFGRVGDETGSTVALAAPLPPGRERPCEIVTPPIERDHLAVLESLLAPARALGFTVPVEAAVHLHVDGGPFRQVHAFTNLVRLFAWWRPQAAAACSARTPGASGSRRCRRRRWRWSSSAGTRGSRRRRPPARWGW